VTLFTVMLAVIVAVLLPPLLSVRVKVPALADAFWAIVVEAGAPVPWPVVVWLTVIVLPVVLLTVFRFASISRTLAVKVPPLPTPLTVQVTAVIVV
jgi:hypothetical protein